MSVEFILDFLERKMGKFRFYGNGYFSGKFVLVRIGFEINGRGFVGVRFY